MKRVAALAAALLIVLVPAVALAADELALGREEAEVQRAAQEEAEAALQQGMEEIIGSVDMSGLESLYDGSDKVFGDTFDEAIRNIAENGLDQVSVEQALDAALGELKNALLGSGGYMAQIVVMLLITGVLGRMESSFRSAGVAKTAFWAGYIAVASLAVAMLTGCVLSARQTLETLSSITETLTPVLVALLAGVGGLSSANVLSPAMAALTGGVFVLIENVIFPAIIVSAALSLAGNISSTIRLQKLTELLDSGVKWMLGLCSWSLWGSSPSKGWPGPLWTGCPSNRPNIRSTRWCP